MTPFGYYLLLFALVGIIFFVLLTNGNVTFPTSGSLNVTTIYIVIAGVILLVLYQKKGKGR